MAEALVKVKKDLGRDAVILNTRTFKAGGMLGVGRKTRVEITATTHIDVVPPGARRGRGPTTTTGKNAPPEKRLPAHKGQAGPQRGRTRADDASLADMADMKEEICAIKSLVEEMLSASRRAKLPEMPEALRTLYRDLIANQVAEEFAQELIESIQPELTGNPDTDQQVARAKLLDTIESMLPTTANAVLDPGQGPRIVALVGPTGVGKTTTIAKLAANFRLREKRRVGLITIDTYRIAAVDQLRTYAKILDVPLAVVLSPEELQPAIRKMADCDIILMDTAGRSQNDDVKLKELKRFLDESKPHEIHLVLSGTNNSAVLSQTVDRFTSLGVDHIIFTKLDEAVGFGVILNVIRKVDRRLSFVTTGQDVPNDIEPGDGRRLAEAIVGGAVAFHATGQGISGRR